MQIYIVKRLIGRDVCIMVGTFTLLKTTSQVLLKVNVPTMGHLFFGICHIKIIKKRISFQIAKFFFKLCSSIKTIEKNFIYVIIFILLFYMIKILSSLKLPY